ncbi:NAD(P)H-binding protein [Georgenia sp. Z1491]|uniref:NAD(P)H-binding protein n=1 Tax=Georgenia sp. Z1491 TaxID=3416707 RepID=UPI003CF055C6
MSFVVTGATGQLGRLVIEHLLDRGVAPDTITATARSVDRLADVADRGVTTAYLDYAQPIDGALKAGDTLLLVSSNEVGQRFTQHSAVIEAATAAGVARIVYTSLLGASTSSHVLAPEHKQTEEAIAASGIPFTILRNGWYSENYRPNFDQAAASGAFAGAAHDGLVSPAARADYAEAAAVVLTTEGHEGKVYELAGAPALTTAQIAQEFGAALGREISYVDLDADAFAAQLTEAGLDEGLVGFLVAADTNTAEGTLHSTSTDLQDLLGRPSTPLSETVATWAAESEAGRSAAGA